MPDIETDDIVDVEFEIENQEEPLEVDFDIDGAIEEHQELAGRGKPDQHPISAITGLEEALENTKYNEGRYIQIDNEKRINVTLQAGTNITIENGNINSTDKASDIYLDRWDYPEPISVQSVLSDVEPDINFTGNLPTTEYMEGDEVSGIHFTWNPIANTVRTLTDNHGHSYLIQESEDSFDYPLAVTATTTFTLTQRTLDGEHRRDDTYTIEFLPSFYYGTSSSTSLTSEIINTFSHVYMRDVVPQMKLSFDCTGGKYMYLCYPDFQGLVDVPKFEVGGIVDSDYDESTIEFTNELGYTRNYTVIKFNKLQHSNSINLEIVG